MASVIFLINIRRGKTIFSPSVVKSAENLPKLLVWMLGSLSQLSMMIIVREPGLIKVFSRILSLDFVEDFSRDFLPWRIDKDKMSEDRNKKLKILLLMIKAMLMMTKKTYYIKIKAKKIILWIQLMMQNTWNQILVKTNLIKYNRLHPWNRFTFPDEFL